VAFALREGHMSIMDYYRLRNIQADTDMRSSISRVGVSSSAQKSAS
jgi:uncharacterized protein YqfA (UPF0365 family)